MRSNSAPRVSHSSLKRSILQYANCRNPRTTSSPELKQIAHANGHSVQEPAGSAGRHHQQDTSNGILAAADGNIISSGQHECLRAVVVPIILHGAIPAFEGAQLHVLLLQSSCCRGSPGRQWLPERQAQFVVVVRQHQVGDVGLGAFHVPEGGISHTLQGTLPSAAQASSSTVLHATSQTQGTSRTVARLCWLWPQGPASVLTQRPLTSAISQQFNSLEHVVRRQVVIHNPVDGREQRVVFFPAVDLENLLHLIAGQHPLQLLALE